MSENIEVGVEHLLATIDEQQVEIGRLKILNRVLRAELAKLHEIREVELDGDES